jgi:vancomycin resistance protein YoaR
MPHQLTSLDRPAAHRQPNVLLPGLGPAATLAGAMEERLVPTPLIAPPAVVHGRPGRRSRAVAVRERGRVRHESLVARPRGRARHAATRAFFAFFLTIATASTFAASYLNGFAAEFAGRALPHVAVGGVELAGLDRTGAEAKIRETLPSLVDGDVTLVFGGERTTLRYGGLGRDYDMARMLNAAFAVGHTGDVQTQVVDGLRSLLRRSEFATSVRFDRAAVQEQVEAVVAGLLTQPSDASIALADDATGFVVTPSRSGRRFEASPVVARVLAGIDTTDPSSIVVHLRAHHIAPTYTTWEAESAVRYVRHRTDIGLALVGQGLAFQIPATSLRRWYEFAKTAEGGFSVTLHDEQASAEVAAIAKKVYVAPVDARLLSAGSTIVGYRPSRAGRELDAEATVANLLAALEADPPDRGPKPVPLVFRTIAPAFTDAEAKAMVGPLVKISSWTVKYTPSERNFNGANIRIPTSALDGYVLKPGDSFAFWHAIGEVSRARGYGDGGVIRNGRTDPTGALAGGICSCSTTLFNAAARAGLEILERHNHYYYIDRYPVGLDATVLKGSSGPIQDMRVRNDTRSPILIRGVNEPGAVTFEMYGVPDGRTVSFSTPIVKNRIAARDLIVYTSSLPRGVARRIEYPAAGFDSWVTRTVRDRTGRIVHQETFRSHYSRVDGITLIGR